MLNFLRPKDNPLRTASDALRGASENRSLISWQTVLAWYARIIALLWLMKGLGAWAIILEIFNQTGLEFALNDIDYQSVVVYFAIIDVIAAVGLWMVSAWGGVVWLIAVMSYIAISVIFPNLVTSNVMISGLLGVFVLLYLLLSWLAAWQEVQ